MWLSVKEYMKKEGIKRQAVYKRIKQGNIPAERIRKGDNGKIEIKVRED